MPDGARFVSGGLSYKPLPGETTRLKQLLFVFAVALSSMANLHPDDPGCKTFMAIFRSEFT